MNKSTTDKRPERREYDEFFESLPPDRQIVHLRTIAAYVVAITRRHESEPPALEDLQEIH
jgi:hypothetical protein